MGPKHLSYFKVENFKRFDSLEVNDIGQFNLVVGDNNVGKTTLLEALLFDENYSRFLINLEFALDDRDIQYTNFADNGKKTPNEFRLNYLDFYVRDRKRPIKYVVEFQDSERKVLVLTAKARHEFTTSDIDKFLLQFKISDSPFFALLECDDKSDLLSLFQFEENKSIDYHFPFLGSKNIYDEETFDFSRSISFSNKRLEILKNELKFFVPNLTSIEVANSIISGDNFIILRETDSDIPTPLAAYGDGFIKFFRYLLKIELSTNKRLMLDEIDAGIHYSRMKEFLKKILLSAKNNKVQIFATTHSKECLEYYTKALEELNMQNNGRVIRIANTKSGIKAYTLRFEEFEDALWAENEIR